MDDQDAEEKWVIGRLDACDITHLALKIDAKDNLYKLLITENDASYRHFAELHDDSDDWKWVRFYKKD